jgi:CBS domain-containing protein
MNATSQPFHALTAGDLMSRPVTTVPLQTAVREAARLIHRARAREAVVVDDNGRCVGVLSPADIFRWIEAGCPEAAVSRDGACPYQVRGRLLTGGEAVICVLSHGSCPFQVEQPTTGGRHTSFCTRRGTEPSPFGWVPNYMTTSVVTVRRQAPLAALVRLILENHADRLVVVDESDRPVGVVWAADVLNAVTDRDDGNDPSAGGAICPARHERSEPCSGS